MRAAAILILAGLAVAAIVGAGIVIWIAEDEESGSSPAEVVESALQEAAAAGTVPDDLDLHYDDRHPLFGGTAVEIGAGGLAERVDERPGRAARRRAVRLSREELASLVQELVEIEVWRAPKPKGTPAPDESSAELRVTVGESGVRLSEPYNELGRRTPLGRVKMLLDEFLPRP